jgi:hypothetical protein
MDMTGIKPVIISAGIGSWYGAGVERLERSLILYGLIPRSGIFAIATAYSTLLTTTAFLHLEAAIIVRKPVATTC